MTCVLCHQPVTLLDLAEGGYEGLPAHEHCARAMNDELAAVLAEAERLVLAEQDPRRHRRGVRPTAA